MSSPTLIA